MKEGKVDMGVAKRPERHILATDMINKRTTAKSIETSQQEQKTPKAPKTVTTPQGQAEGDKPQGEGGKEGERRDRRGLPSDPVRLPQGKVTIINPGWLLYVAITPPPSKPFIGFRLTPLDSVGFLFFKYL